ncbi:MAG: hypothetical protein Q9216_006773 [Gyalolechia sp. 2 TL-2023]
MADVISALGKLATTRNTAVLLINQTTTKVMLESAASLQPAISGAAWDAGINCRLLLFRDWQEETDDESDQEKRDFDSHLRFAAVTKADSSSLDGFGEVVPFFIDEEPTAPLPARLKRKRDEIADSASESGELVSDDEFGWVEE